MARARVSKDECSSRVSIAKGPAAAMSRCITGSTLPRCAMMASLMVLPLAGGTVIRRALSLGEAADHGTAVATGFAGALVHIKLLAEVARVAIRIHVIAQRRAAHTDGLLQDFADGF